MPGSTDVMLASSTNFFLVTSETKDLLARLDAFIEAEIKPLQARNDNERFFDHRREHSRTDWDRGGLPAHDWEALLGEMVALSEKAGFWRLAMPKELGGQGVGNLTMAIVRETFAAKGLGLHNDIQNESSIVGNLVMPLVINSRGTDQQKRDLLPKLLDGTARMAFGLTEPDHGSDATHMITTATRDGDNWIIVGEKAWNSGAHHATHNLIIARTSGKDGDAGGLTAFVVPMDSPGFKVEEYLWTLNMPTDHARVSLKNVRVPNSAIVGGEGNGLATSGVFLNENRTRQAASSLGAAVYCIQESVKYANERKVFGKPIAVNQAIQFPLVEMHTECEMVRMLLRDTANKMDHMSRPEVTAQLSHRVSMCNYRANRLACKAADFAMQVHGGMGYSRHKQFEHIYRHHRRYKITEGSEQIQIRNVAKHLFGFGRANQKPAAAKL